MSEPTTQLIDFIDLATDEGYLHPHAAMELREAVASLTAENAALRGHVPADRYEDPWAPGHFIIEHGSAHHRERESATCPICKSLGL